MAEPAPPVTARARARAELSRDIKRLALRQLADEGAGALSLRAVARELGMVSSALYRYFASRDELLTALIVDAYGDLAETISTATAEVEPGRFRSRWGAACHALRGWARREPHRFALIYGSAIPGYRAPADTIAPATAVMTALAGIVDGAARAGALADVDGEAVGGELAAQLDGVAHVLGEHSPAPVLATLAGAFGQLIGMVNLELAGHFVGGFEPADALFDRTVRQMAAGLGLQDLDEPGRAAPEPPA
ncbi:TetR/AcrR family transcriptional regulator [Georgenia daeguensis]